MLMMEFFATGAETMPIKKSFNHRWARMDTDKPNAASLQSSLRFTWADCHRTPNLCRPDAKLRYVITDFSDAIGTNVRQLNLRQFVKFASKFFIRAHPCPSVVSLTP
jgi:hypothetical protein